MRCIGQIKVATQKLCSCSCGTERAETSRGHDAEICTGWNWKPSPAPRCSPPSTCATPPRELQLWLPTPLLTVAKDGGVLVSAHAPRADVLMVVMSYGKHRRRDTMTLCGSPSSTARGLRTRIRRQETRALAICACVKFDSLPLARSVSRRCRPLAPRRLGSWPSRCAARWALARQRRPAFSARLLQGSSTGARAAPGTHLRRNAYAS